MNQPYSANVRTPKAPAACLAIELRRIPNDLQNDLHKWLWAFAERWAYKYSDQPPATLWMKEAWNRGTDSHLELYLACSSKMPHYFLKELAEHLGQWIDKALSFPGRVIVDATDEWVPLCHWQDGKAWDSNDLHNWEVHDQSPVPHETPSSSSSEGGYYFHIETKTYSAQELNTRAFKAAWESGDKEDLGEYLYAHRHILRDASAYAKGHTPLHLAAAAGDLEACDALLGYVSAEVLSERYQTPLLHLANVRGKHPYAAIVSRLSSTVHVTDAKGRTALMYAARGANVRSRQGHLTLVKALLNAGADVTAIDAEGRTALGWAKKDLSLAKPHANAEVIDYLQRHQYQAEMERFFRTHYNHHFDAKGVMHIVPVDGSSTSSAFDPSKVLTHVVE
jgi:hypothetical protein